MKVSIDNKGPKNAIEMLESLTGNKAIWYNDSGTNAGELKIEVVDTL